MVSISVTLLPLLALTSVAAAGDRKCTPDYKKAIFSGGSTFRSVATKAECAQGCVNDASCVGFTFQDTNGSKSCSLFNRIDSETYAPSADASTVSARCMATADLRLLLLPMEKADYPGLDVGNTPAANPTACSYLCQDTSGCFAYSWSGYNGGTCWMKAGKPDKIVPITDGSVVSGQVYACQRPRMDADATGSDMASVLRADWRDCCDVCRRANGCAGFAWNNYNGGTCWLKSAVTGFKNNGGVVSAVL